MVSLTDYSIVTYKNKRYAVAKVKFRGNIVPVVLDQKIHADILKLNKTWRIADNGSLYTSSSNGESSKNVYLHDIVMGKISDIPVVHINKMMLDNRRENLMFDEVDKDIRKNLRKKSRTIDLSGKNIDVNTLPSFVWYLKEDKTHGDRFQVELGDLHWKSSSSNSLSLKYKLEETKKFLRQQKRYNNKEFDFNSMNGDMNAKGISLKKEFYDIIRLANFQYVYNPENNTDEFLKEDKTGLSRLEIKLLKAFDINSGETTIDRLRKMI